MSNDFESLGLTETATTSQVRKAYRLLARRWHPDRFPAGPEREWANKRMVEINRAYSACMAAVKPDALGEMDKLKRVRALIDEGQLNSARAMLMEISTRQAEWNYLFGTILMKRNECEKALVYLSVAAHQRPGEQKYVTAHRVALGLQPQKKKALTKKKAIAKLHPQYVGAYLRAWLKPRMQRQGI